MDISLKPDYLLIETDGIIFNDLNLKNLSKIFESLNIEVYDFLDDGEFIRTDFNQGNFHYSFEKLNGIVLDIGDHNFIIVFDILNLIRDADILDFTEILESKYSTSDSLLYIRV